MKTKLIALMLVAGGSLFAETHFSVGVGIGSPGYYGPAPVAGYAAYRPPYPGNGYVWIDGYNDEYGRWFDGYWGLPPYAGAFWTGPRFYGGRWFNGYWGGPRYERGFDRDDYRFREGFRGGFRGEFHEGFRGEGRGGFREAPRGDFRGGGRQEFHGGFQGGHGRR